LKLWRRKKLPFYYVPFNDRVKAEKKIINIHPSLLPAFPGANTYRQAYERGVKVVGVTSHFVTPNLDEGPIIAQEVLRVRSNEPLASIVKRGQALETTCMLAAVRTYVTKRLDVHWGRVYS
jgi:formyltetrahydrofolate deformylase